MASGTGRFASSNYGAGTSSTGVKLVCDVSQSVNSQTRKATITVHAMMAFYRISGNWNISNGTAIINNSGTTNIQTSVDGNASSQVSSLTLVGNTSFTATAGNYYTQADGYVRSGSTGNSEVTKSVTFDFNAAGDPITKNWNATLNFRGTQMYLSGTVTTDGISSLSHFYGSVSGQSKKIQKLYGSVNGQTKLIKKLYGSVNGQTKIIYQHN